MENISVWHSFPLSLISECSGHEHYKFNFIDVNLGIFKMAWDRISVNELRIMAKKDHKNKVKN